MDRAFGVLKTRQVLSAFSTREPFLPYLAPDVSRLATFLLAFADAAQETILQNMGKEHSLSNVL